MNHDARWTTQKIAKRIELIREFQHRTRHPIAPFGYRMLPGPDAMPDVASSVDEESDWSRIDFDSYWGAWTTDFLLKTTFSVPETWASDAPVALYLPLGEAGDFNHPEALAYVDGEPLAAVDRHHNEISLSEGVRDGGPHSLVLHGWTGLGGEPYHGNKTRLFMRTCWVVEIDMPTRQLISVARVALGVATQLSESDPVRGLLLTALDRAFKRVDTRDPIGDEFFSSVPRALQGLLDEIDSSGAPMDVDVIAAGHAHIDVAWLWTLGQTRRKVGRTFSTVLHLMNQFPDFHFTQSQPQLYKYAQEAYPEMFEQIQRRVEEGRWEPIGGTWVEPDCNSIGAESLARQFLLGRRFFREHFGGRDAPVLWLPDSFGYAWALPQLIVQAGMKYFITSKMSWNQFNHMPHQILWWQGIDGTRVLTHFLTTAEGSDLRPHATTYNGNISAAQVFHTWKNFRQKDLHSELMTAFGWGDGGGGPSREMLENLDRFKKHPGAPRVRPGSVREFMERLDEEHGPELPVWNGEFYLEYHRGTFTSQARTKRNNRKSEFLMHDAEFLAAYAAVTSDFHYPADGLNRAWELICLNQFHDILPGSSITDVYADSAKDYAAILEIADETRDRAVAAISRSAPSAARMLAVNPTSFGGDRVGFLARPVGEIAGTRMQSVADGTLLAFTDLPPYSVTTHESGPGIGDDTGLSVATRGDEVVMENRQIRVRIDRAGELSGVYDLEAGREVIEAGKRGNRLLAFEDRPLAYDAWDIDIFFEDRTEHIAGVEDIEILEVGPIRACVQVRRRYRQSEVVQRICLYYHSRRIDFETEIDWHESHILLKAAFPVAILNTRATFDIQWGNVERATHRNTSWDWAKFETAAQKWADIGEGDYGVALLNESKHGYETRDNEIRLSLLKSATSPDPVADQGNHRFTYSLLPHPGDWRALVPSSAYDLNDPILLREIEASREGRTEAIASTHDREAESPSLQAPFVSLDSPRAVIETVKQAEDGNGVVVRLYEHHRSRGNIRVSTGFALGRAFLCNLLEENQSELEVAANSVTFSLRPYQIVTVRLLPS